MEVCSSLGFFSHCCGKFPQLQEVTSKWPAGQAGQDLPRQEEHVGAVSLLCAVPKGGDRGRKAHTRHVRPTRWVSTGLAFLTVMGMSTSAECRVETGKIP